ncbi:MAG TPA: HAMP domain-containing sensor histidine kinase [Jatrophihabitantaceae bacterium]|nr:HAMP domain-containing sensor histidine kinase [Jatrophihabitantaceae bacterium]
MTRRASLAGRITLVAVAAALVTALIAAVLSVGLIRHADESSARASLAKVADAAAATADRGPGPLNETRVRRFLRSLNFQFATIDASGRVTATTSGLAAEALSSSDLSRVLAGQDVSTKRTVAGSRVLIEARPTANGAIVLVQRKSDALAGGARAVRRILLALLIGTAVAAVLGFLLARWLSRPLRRTAEAAHALASGRRDVAVAPEGPAEVAEVADAMNTLTAHLAYAEGRQRSFLMSVSHELRTPLTAITGYAESLSTGVVPADDMQRVGAVLLGESHRLQRLVSDLLDLARVDAADFRVEPSPVDVAAFAGSAAQVWQDRCSSVGVAFSVEIAPHPVPLAWADPARLRQAVDGLLENALRVTPAGAPIVLAVRAEDSSRPVVVEVRDGGPGLTDDDLAVAFDRAALYERYRGVRQVGTGLGLAIVAGLVTRIGGTIEAGHAPEGGARFTLRLPSSSPSS